MKLLSLTALVTLIGIAPAVSQTTSEGRALAELSFATVDSNGNGSIDMGESHNFGEDVFTSMDADDNALITEDEFLSWGYGFQNIAKDHDKELAYRTALRVVFSFWDSNGDGDISRTEQRTATNRDFRRADINANALLTEEEFFGGFSVMVAIRVALKPENN